MDKQLKVGVFNKIIRAFRQNPNISELTKDGKEKYSLSCKICGEIEFLFSLKENQNFLLLKGTTPAIELPPDVTVTEFASEITEDTEIRYASYEENDKKIHIIFQLLTPLLEDSGTTGIDLQKLVFNETLEFVQIMYRNKDKLGCQHISASMENLDFTKEAEDDPYGFNTFSDDEIDIDDFADNEEPTEKTLPEMAKPESMVDVKELPESDNDDIFADDDSKQSNVYVAPADLFAEESHMQANASETSGQELRIDINKDSDGSKQMVAGDEVSRMLKEIEDRKAARDAKRQARHQQRNQETKESEETVENIPNPVSNVLDIFSPTTGNDEKTTDANLEVSASAFDNADKNTGGLISEFKTESPMEKDCIEQKNSDMGDMFAEFLSDDEDSVAGKRDKDKKNVQKSGLHLKKNKQGGNGKQKKGDIIVDKPNMETGAIKRSDAPETVAQDGVINYQRAPEVVDQMKHLYAEMDETFAMRKEQADYREKTLDSYKERLDDREKELGIREERLSADYESKKADLDKKFVEVETSKNELAFQWKKLDAEKETLEIALKSFEEEKLIFEKTKKMDAKSVDSEDRVQVLNNEIEEKNKELEVLRETFATAKNDYDAQVKSLREQVSELQQMNLSEVAKEEYELRIAALEDTVKTLNEDISDYEEDVKDLTEETEQKSKVIDVLRTQQSAMENKAAEWEKKEQKYKAQIVVAQKAAQVADDNDVLMDKLDAANIRIQELEAEISKKGISEGQHEKEINSLKQELEKTKMDLKKADEAYEKEKQARGNTSTSNDVVKKDINQIAAKIKEDLSQIGIEVEPVATNSDFVLSGGNDSMPVIVNVSAGIIYIEKQVRRGIKYRTKFENWNSEDIRTSYIFTDDKVICKCTYEDVAKAAMDIMGRFSTLDDDAKGNKRK